MLWFCMERFSIRWKGFPLQNRVLAVICLLALAIAGLRYQSELPKHSPSQVAWYNDNKSQVILTGWLDAPVDRRDEYDNLRIQVTSIQIAGENQSVAGLVLARVPPGQDLMAGQVLRLRGFMKTPQDFEDFSYRDYLARQGIHSYLVTDQVTVLPFQGGNRLNRMLDVFRQHLLTVNREIFPEPEASLLAGILLGDDSGLPADLQQAFRDTGTSHIIAISGFNIAILAGMLSLLFGKFMKARSAALATIVGIAAYTLLVGAGASVVRASLMCSVTILGSQFGRKGDSLNSLGLAAGGMCLFDPHLPWDISFQLSFAATLGLVLYAGPIQDWAGRMIAKRFGVMASQKVAQPLAEILLFSLAAQVTTLPLIAYYFGRISLVSFLANPFILPAQPAVMLTSGLALLLGIIHLPLGQIIAWLAWPFSAYTVKLVELFARLPHAVIVLGDASLITIVLFYIFLFSITFQPAWMKNAFSHIKRPVYILFILFGLTMLIWRVAFSQPDGRLHITFLDVGSADAILVQTPGGRNLLINGGPSQSNLSAELGKRLSPLDHKLDLLVVASPLEEQVGSLPGTLERFPAAGVLWSGATDSSYSSQRLQRWLSTAEVPITQAKPGQVIDLGDSARLVVVDVTYRGAILLLEWKDFRALLPIGLDFESMDRLLEKNQLARVTILLLANSGYGGLNTEEWIAAIRPQVCILSVAAGDEQGRPEAETLQAVGDIPLLRTDHNGWIEISSDGDQLWIEVENK